MDILYHGSESWMDTGSVLAPRPDGYVQRQLDAEDPLETLLERVRPTDALPRSQAVFMLAEIEDIEAAGGVDDYVYEVRPTGECTAHDMAWMSLAEARLSEGLDAEAERFARAYWSGEAYRGDEAGSLLEWMSPGADVLRLEADLTFVLAPHGM